MSGKEKHYQDLESIALDLKSLSEAFAITGNEKMYSELEYLANSISLNIHSLEMLDKEELDNRIKEMNKTSQAIFEACLHKEGGKNDK